MTVIVENGAGSDNDNDNDNIICKAMYFRLRWHVHILRTDEGNEVKQTMEVL